MDFVRSGWVHLPDENTLGHAGLYSFSWSNSASPDWHGAYGSVAGSDGENPSYIYVRYLAFPLRCLAS